MGAAQMQGAGFLGGARNKAGMPETDGLERQKIDEIIREASKSSKFYKHQQRREARIQEKIDKLKAKRVQLEQMFTRDVQAYENARRDLEKWARDMEAQRDLTRTIVCIDMDAFFAAVEALDRPELAHVPMAVGGKSMLSTANYAARKFGVVSAMPGYMALKLCPQLLIIRPHYEKYKAAAEKFHTVFRRYDESFSHYSLDEATLDITHLVSAESSPDDIVHRLRSEVFEASGLTCSAGIAPNKMLAKICSNINKPNGQFYLANSLDKILEFTRGTRVVRVNGIGKVSASIIEGVFGATTLGQLWEHRVWAKLLFTPIHAEFLLRCCLGIGSSSGFDPEAERQSMSVERTFATTADLEAMLRILQNLCQELARHLEMEGLCGRNISIKMKTSDFQVSTRAETLKRTICSEKDLLHHAKAILLGNRPADLRLLGVRLAALQPAGEGSREETLERFMSIEAETLVKCPICLAPIRNAKEGGGDESERLVNDHVDLCLTRNLINQEESASHAAVPCRKRPKPARAGSISCFFPKAPRPGAG